MSAHGIRPATIATTIRKRMQTQISRRPIATRDYQLEEHSDRTRSNVEAHIREHFQASHGARLDALMPRLFTISDGGAPICAFGLREAAVEPLYMERYLDQPVESAVARLVGAPVRRDAIVEVGNLVAEPGGARVLIVLLTHHLNRIGIEWVVFTAVAALRAAFRRLGLQPFVLAAADPRRLANDERDRWGDYFAANPLVMGGSVSAGIRALAGSAAPTGSYSA